MATITRGMLARFCLLGAITAAFAAPVQAADDYPSKPVRIIVPFGAGGPGDVYTRLLGQWLSEELKQPFIVEARPGAGASIGQDAAAKSAPDGYTLLIVSNANTTNDSLLENRKGSLMRDFVPVSGMNYSELVVTVTPSVDAKTMVDFIALAKRNPGKITYASSGIGTAYHMAGELLKMMTGTDLVHVPHKASGDMRTSVMGGHVNMMFDAPTSAASAIKDGNLRALAVSGKNRSQKLPDVPTVSETVAPGYDATIWFGVVAPTGTPPSIVAKLHASLQKAFDDPKVKQIWVGQGVTPWKGSAEDFGKFLRDDIAKSAKIINTAGLSTR